MLHHTEGDSFNLKQKIALFLRDNEALSFTAGYFVKKFAPPGRQVDNKKQECK